MPESQRSAVALRHVAFEDLGLLGPILSQNGWSVSYREAPADDLRDPAIEQSDLLIVLGGPIGVYDTKDYPFLLDEIRVLERRLAAGRATLGICLGAQLMAAALGAKVFAGATKEIGWGAVDLTAEGRASCLQPLADDGARVLHWHGDTFDLPAGASRLASNANYENQAFSVDTYGLGLQFHLEVDPAALEKWYVGHAVELATARISVPELRRATAVLSDRVRTQAQSIFTMWLRQFGEP